MDNENQRHILGIPEMDEQHRYLYGLFDMLENNVEVRDREKTNRLLPEIERYVLFHFASEELLMRSYNFPGFAVHQSDHENAGNRFVRFLDDFEAGTLNPAALRIFLTGWLMEHSMTSDAAYAAWIKKCRQESGITSV
jgi:hemerythrin